MKIYRRWKNGIIIEKSNGNLIMLDKHMQTNNWILSVLTYNCKLATCNFSSLRAGFQALKYVVNN